MSSVHEPGLTAWQAQPHVRAAQKRTVTLLATVQATGAVGAGVSSALGSLLVESVTGSAAGAGLARTAVTLGAAAAALPLALLARRAGRRLALSAGWITATAGAVVLVLAAAIRSLPLMLAGMLLFGANSASNLQGRYAAADLARPGNRARALSVVVWSTTIGAVIGPNLAAPGATVASALHLPELAGAFVLAAACQFLAAALLWLWLRPDPLLLAQQYQNQGAAQASTQVRQQGSRRDGIAAVRAHLIRTPRALFAFTAIVVAHTAMSAVMAMTPVSMAADGMTLTIVGVTISIHIAGMYAFSPAVGWLADRIGHLPGPSA